jgi:uncharacterized membrane-anchored protein
MKKILLPLFALMCLAQWYIPGKMIYDQEVVLLEGTLYKFKTEPIDPTDPFRGSYITLNFEANTVEVNDEKEWNRGEPVFVTLRNDSAGYAQIESISKTIPEGRDYIQAKVDYVSRYDPFTVRLALPFERFYLEESKAPEAERLYWEAQQNDSSQVAYAVVSIQNGNAALKDVMINNRSIVDIVREANEKQGK